MTPQYEVFTNQDPTDINQKARAYRMCPVYGESNRDVKTLQARRKVSTQS